MARRPNPTSLLQDPGTTLKLFTTADNVSVQGSGSVGEVSSEIQRDGNDTYKVSVAAGVTTDVELNAGFSQDWQNRTLGWWVYVTDHTKIQNFVLYAGLSGYSSFITDTYDMTPRPYNGWHFIAAAGDLWDAATVIQPLEICKLRITPVSGQAPIVYFAECRANFRSRPKILLTFDDGLDDHYDVARVDLDTYGFKGNFNIIESSVGGAGGMTLPQLRALHDQGHDICLHGAQNFTSIGGKATSNAIKSELDFLTANGLERGALFCAYPFGAFDADSLPALRANGVKYARGTFNAVGAYTLAFFPLGIETNAALAIPIIGHQAANSVANVLSQIDGVIRQGSVGVLMYHGLPASGATGADVNRADFQSVLSGLRDRVRAGHLDVITASQLDAQINGGRAN